MIHRHSHGRRIKKQSLGQPAFLFGDVREPFQFCRVPNRQIESGLSAVAIIEEDGIDDLTRNGEEAEGDHRDTEDRFDILDLLLDETD